MASTEHIFDAPVIRTFRDLSDEELKDPEVLLALAAFGWSKTVDWDELLKSHRIILLSEAGTGKTFECKKQAERLAQAGCPAFFVELVELAAKPLDQLLSPSDIRLLEAWRQGQFETAYFFLDSIDEMELSHGKFQVALRNLARAIDGRERFAKVVATSRPISIDFETFRKELPLPDAGEPITLVNPRNQFDAIVRGETRKARLEAAKPENRDNAPKPWRTVALMPLSNGQIDQILAVNGVTDGDALKAEIEKRRVWDFARRPQDLIEICAYWNRHKQLGNRAEQVAQNIAAKLQEPNDRKVLVQLPEEKALEGAERLALALALTRRKTIRVSGKSLDKHETDLALDPGIVLSDWSAKERNELLQRGIFGFASYGRVRFHHRSVLEFLAAQRLHKLVSEKRMPTRALLRMLFGERYGQKVVFPATRSITAWLALWNDHVQQEVLAREPQALIDDGDPESFSPIAKNAILEAFSSRYAASDWRGIRFPYDQIRRFACAELAPAIRRIWNTGITNPEIEELIVDVIEAGRIAECVDIAREIAVDTKANSNNRTTALMAVCELDTSTNANAVATGVLDPKNRWSERAKQNLLDVIFPKHITVDQFCQILQQFTVDQREVGGPSWHLPRLFAALELATDLRNELRTKITKLLAGSIEKSVNWPHFTSRYSYLGTGLAALCQIDLNSGTAISDDLIEACVVSRHCHDREYGDEKPSAEVRLHFVNADAGVRQCAFRIESKFFLAHAPSDDAWTHCYHSLYEGVTGSPTQDDIVWLLAEAENQSLQEIERCAVFEAAVRLVEDDPKQIEQCKRISEGSPTMETSFAKWCAPRVADPEIAKWQLEDAERKAQHEREEDARVKGWHDWRDEVIANPDQWFSPSKRGQFVANLWHILNSEEAHSGRRATWQSALVIELFGPDVAERAAQAFKAYWRKHKVSLGSERKEKDRNLTYYWWLYGLSGLYAEADAQPDWAGKLTEGEARRAARYVPVEHNLPDWLESLLTSQPKAVDHILGTELSRQLATAVGYNFPDLISDFYNATDSTRSFFGQRVWDWMNGKLPIARTDEARRRLHEHVDRALAWLIKTPINGGNAALADFAKRKLKSGLGGHLAMLWLNTLLATDPVAGIAVLRRDLPKLSTADRYRFCERLFAALGERSGVHFGPNLSDPSFSASDLHELVRLAYQEIARASDIDRSGGGAYSPTHRDNAQQGRDVVFSALIKKDGPDAWTVKQAMRTDPLFAHFRDRLDHLARERVAEEAEGEPLTEEAVRQLDRYGEAPPADRDGMFELMLDRISDLEHDLVADFSERELLASITGEAVMQRTLARRLKDRSNHAYKVDREAEVVDAKKTDIRLRSMGSDQQAVIELKLANNGYSVRDLLDALEVQLVGQYLRHDDCKAGCLLVTMAKPRGWEHPETGAKIALPDVVTLLNVRAEEIAASCFHQIRLKVLGIDLSQ